MHSLIRTQILDLRMRSANPQPDAIITKTLYYMYVQRTEQTQTGSNRTIALPIGMPKYLIGWELTYKGTMCLCCFSIFDQVNRSTEIHTG